MVCSTQAQYTTTPNVYGHPPRTQQHVPNHRFMAMPRSEPRPQARTEHAAPPRPEKRQPPQQPKREPGPIRDGAGEFVFASTLLRWQPALMVGASRTRWQRSQWLLRSGICCPGRNGRPGPERPGPAACQRNRDPKRRRSHARSVVTALPHLRRGNMPVSMSSMIAW
jgi:hypothetical protein